MPKSYANCADCRYIHGRHLPEVAKALRSHPLSLEDNGSRTLLIFQAPGIEEWKSGKPISSDSAQSAGGKLRKAFHLLGKQRTDYNISNVVQCFPGKLAPRGDEKPRDNRPPKSVRRACSKWLREDISKGNYTRIVVFGIPAEETVKELGHEDYSRFLFVPHPTASGISIAMLSEYIG
jgi:uracil-DNA glycosylase family 4